MNSLLKIALVFIISTFLIFPFHIFNSLLVKAWAEESGPLIINFKPVTRAEKGKEIEIVAEIESGNIVMTPELYYRKQGEIKYNKIRMERNKNVFTAVIPQSASDSEGIEYYIIAEDSNNNQVSEGSPERPYFIAVTGEADEEPPTIRLTPLIATDKVDSRKGNRDSIFKKWWFYAILVAVGGGTAAALSSGGGGGQDSVTKGSVVVE